MSRKLFGCLALSALGCATPTRPTEAEGVFSAALPPEVDDLHALRHAIVWLEGSNPRVIEAGRVQERIFDVRVRWPEGVAARELRPLERLLVAPGAAEVTASGRYEESTGVYADAYRPRVVAYRDADGDRELDLAESSPDRIVASDHYVGIAALLDPEAALRRLSLDQALALYADGQEYSRFRLVTSNGLELVATSNTPVHLFQGIHAERREELFCARNVAAGTAPVSLRVHVDEPLDPDEVCPSGVESCDPSALRAMPLPEYEPTPDVERHAQCRRGAELAAFSVFSSTSACSECICTNEPSIDIFVAARSELPAWWPCGEDVAYCGDGADVTSAALCLRLFEGPSPEDAGVPDAGIDGG